MSLRWFWLAIVFQILVSIYGGYFGAGIGILMLASLGILGFKDIHEMNAVKNALAFLINVCGRTLLHCQRTDRLAGGRDSGHWRNRGRIFRRPFFTETSPEEGARLHHEHRADHQRRDVLQTTARVIPNERYFFFFSGLAFSTTQVFACSNSVLNPFAKSCVPYSKSTTKQKVKKTKRTSQNSPRMSDMSRTVP